MAFRWALLIGLVVPTTGAAASCAGLSAAAIDSRFSEAAAVCRADSPGAAAAAPLYEAAEFESPATAVIRVAGARAEKARRQTARRPAVDPGHEPLLTAIGQRYRVDPRLLAAIVAKESAGRLDAVSHKGALGLMQLMPATARGLGVRDTDALLTDPVLNLSAGATYLKQMQARFGNNVPLVLAAYNAGPGAVGRYGGVPPYRETRDYVATITSRYAQTRGGGGRATAR